MCMTTRISKDFLNKVHNFYRVHLTPALGNLKCFWPETRKKCGEQRPHFCVLLWTVVIFDFAYKTQMRQELTRHHFPLWTSEVHCPINSKRRKKITFHSFVVGYLRNFSFRFQLQLKLFSLLPFNWFESTQPTSLSILLAPCHPPLWFVRNPNSPRSH